MQGVAGTLPAMKQRTLITVVMSVLGAVTLSLLALGTPIAALGAAAPLTVCPNLPQSAPSASPTAGTEQFFACPSPATSGQPATNHTAGSRQGSGGTTTSGTAGSSGSPSTDTSGNAGSGSTDRALVGLPEFGMAQVGTSGIGSHNGSPVGFLGLGAGSWLLLFLLLLIALAVIVNRHRLNAAAFRMRHAVGA